jgi:hypothetical protein
MSATTSATAAFDAAVLSRKVSEAAVALPFNCRIAYVAAGLPAITARSTSGRSSTLVTIMFARKLTC